MAKATYEKEITALLVIDPYNDFISQGGKIWDHIRAVAEANDCVPHMLQVLNAARNAGLRVFYALHHRYRPGDYETWKYIAPIQKAAWEHKIFEYATWGAEIRSEFEPKPGDIVAQEHWCSSGFANTDLDLQLKKHGIHKLPVQDQKPRNCRPEHGGNRRFDLLPRCMSPVVARDSHLARRTNFSAIEG